MHRAVVFDIKRYAIHDGPGIRATVFLKGCPLDCWWCHNPEGRLPQPQPMARPGWAAGSAREGARLEADRGEPVGRLMSVAEVMREIDREVLFLDESGGGVTFSGGEPLMQAEFLAAALRACKERELETAVDTSGYAPPDLLLGIIDDVDLFLYDLKLMNEAAHRHYTGVSNKPILANFRTLCDRGKRLRVRFPVIPGVTDGERNVTALIGFLGDLCPGATIDILPYHRSGEAKCVRLGMPSRMSGCKPPSSEAVAALGRRMEAAGFKVKIGA